MSGRPVVPGSGNVPELAVDHLKVHFRGERRLFDVVRGKPASVVRAVDDVSFDIMRNEVLGLVGETGCGKSTIAKTVMRMNPITEGRILYRNDDVGRLDAQRSKAYFAQMQMIWQDPASSLNPRMKVNEILSRPLIRFGLSDRKEIPDRVNAVAEMVGLNPKEIDRYPHEFSGGGKQRIVIARALIVQPSFIIADEPTSSLDVSIQAQVLNLMGGLKDKLSLTMLYISHDLSTISFMSSRVGIMYFGRIVEILPNENLLRSNSHWYTNKLIDAIPKGRRVVNAEVSPEAVTRLNYDGCIYYHRCPNARSVCATERPTLREVGKDHFVACHFPIDSRR